MHLQKLHEMHLQQQHHTKWGNCRWRWLRRPDAPTATAPHKMRELQVEVAAPTRCTYRNCTRCTYSNSTTQNEGIAGGGGCADQMHLQKLHEMHLQQQHHTKWGNCRWRWLRRPDAPTATAPHKMRELQVVVVAVPTRCTCRNCTRCTYSNTLNASNQIQMQTTRKCWQLKTKLNLINHL